MAGLTATPVGILSFNNRPTLRRRRGANSSYSRSSLPPCRNRRSRSGCLRALPRSFRPVRHDRRRRPTTHFRRLRFERVPARAKKLFARNGQQRVGKTVSVPAAWRAAGQHCLRRQATSFPMLASSDLATDAESSVPTGAGAKFFGHRGEERIGRRTGQQNHRPGFVQNCPVPIRQLVANSSGDLLVRAWRWRRAESPRD